MKSNQLKENEQSSVCRAAGGVRGGSPQLSKLACSDISETPQTPMTRYAALLSKYGRKELINFVIAHHIVIGFQ